MRRFAPIIIAILISFVYTFVPIAPAQAQVRWTEEEKALKVLWEDFSKEIKASNLVYVIDISHCPSDILLVNGLPAKLGPYGNTISVPKQGAVLSGIHSQRICDGSGSGTESWRAFVRPGNYILIYENAIKTNMPLDAAFWTPWEICGELRLILPQWQPLSLPNVVKNCLIYSRTDPSASATLRRLGFENSGPWLWTISGYNWYGKGRVDLNLPPFHWMDSNQINLPGGSFTVKVIHNSWGDFDIVQFYPTEGTDALGDVPFADVDQPIVFVPYNLLDLPFTWKDYPIYQVLKSGQIQQLVWD